MVWNPTQSATDIRAIIPNLLGYIETNAPAALSWANDSVALDTFKTIFNNASRGTVIEFPSLIVSGDRATTVIDDRGLVIIYTIELEMMITGPEPTQLTKDIKAYVMAVESMILNIPMATLMANVDGTGTATITAIDKDYDQSRKGVSLYGQSPSVRIVMNILEGM